MILQDMVHHNTYRDVTTVNMPADFCSTPESTQDYMFAAYMPPGRHHFLLYDPLFKKAYVKEFTIHPNSFDSYVDFPRTFNDITFKKPTPNVWSKFREDNMVDFETSMLFDIAAGDLQFNYIIREEIKNSVKETAKRN